MSSYRPGYSFVGWTGRGSGSFSGPGSPSITMTGPIGEVANFLASTSISLTLSRASISLGTPVTLRGSTTPSPGSVQVTLSVSKDSGATWSTIISIPTDGTGSYSTSWTPPYPGSYMLQASWSGNTLYAGATSATTPLTVTGTTTATQKLILNAPAAAPRGQTTRLSFTVFNPSTSSLKATVLIEITGPNNYVSFDLVQLSVGANSQITGYSDWNVPNQIGAYVVTIGLLPAQATAYDTETIQVT